MILKMVPGVVAARYSLCQLISTFKVGRRELTVRRFQSQRDEGSLFQDFFCGQRFQNRALVRGYNDRAPTPAQQQAGSISVQPWDFIVNVWTHYSNYDTAWMTAFTQDGLTNYFGERKASNYRISWDMARDSRRYSQWHATYYPETFWRETSNEYSPNWQGPMIYDHIDMQSDVYESGVRWHHARVRFTVGYTYVNQVLKIYALTYQVLS
jgi:hypothetical protein